jgi:hypothetical protein
MGSEQAHRHISNAEDAQTDKDKIKHILEALKALTHALRDLEGKVRNLA